MTEISIKDSLVMLPVAGSALAVTFDVGYLSGIDINYFTLFSISEHIVFALEALPAAMLFAGLGVLTVLMFKTVRNKNRRRGAVSAEPTLLIAGGYFGFFSQLQSGTRTYFGKIRIPPFFGSCWLFPWWCLG